MLQRFVISIWILGFLNSCALGLTKGLPQQTPSEATVQNPYFATEEVDYVYKTQLEVYGSYFSGILAIKKTGPAIHRVVFTTEMGKTLFDFEFQKDRMTVNYIVDDLDRKLLLKVLENDFGMLVSETQEATAVFESPDTFLYKVPDENRWRYYEFEKKTHTLQRIYQTSSSREKVLIEFTDLTDTRAKNIKITHYNIKLTIDLYSF